MVGVRGELGEIRQIDEDARTRRDEETKIKVVGVRVQLGEIQQRDEETKRRRDESDKGATRSCEPTLVKNVERSHNLMKTVIYIVRYIYIMFSVRNKQ